jgi:ubiquinone/menaquinone biosynthesis C-methylase UbiE
MARIKPFERYALEYESWFERNKYAYESELLAVEKAIPEIGEGIEIGVGSGRFAQPFGIRYGLEPSFEMRHFARKRGIKVIDGIAENLPIKNDCFDIILMVTTICFVDDIKKAFNEAYRILKNNGIIIIGFVDKNSKIGKLYQRNKNKSVFYKEANFFSVEQVISHLKKSSFTDLHFYQTIFKSLDDIKRLEPIKKGYGQGSFVVIKAKKSF